MFVTSRGLGSDCRATVQFSLSLDLRDSLKLSTSFGRNVELRLSLWPYLSGGFLGLSSGFREAFGVFGQKFLVIIKRHAISIFEEISVLGFKTCIPGSRMPEPSKRSNLVENLEVLRRLGAGSSVLNSFLVTLTGLAWACKFCLVPGFCNFSIPTFITRGALFELQSFDFNQWFGRSLFHDFSFDNSLIVRA